MKVYFDRNVLLGFFLALGILTVLGIYSYKNSQDSINTSRMVSHTNAVLYRIEKLHSLNLEIEADLMRCVIAGDSTFPSFIRRNLSDARDHFMALQDLVKDNASQKHRVDSIQILGVGKVGLIEQIIKMRVASKEAAQQLVSHAKNRKLLEGLRCDRAHAGWRNRTIANANDGATFFFFIPSQNLN